MKPISIYTAIFILLFQVPAFSQRDFTNVEIKTTKVAEGIYMLEGSGGNIGVSVGEDGVLIVDDQFAPLSDKILSAIDKLGGGKVKFVVNTHWHGDHTGGNENFGKTANIVAHINVRNRLSTKQVVESSGKEIEPISKQGLPVITFDDSVVIHFNNEDIRIIYYSAGHTDGDSIVIFEKANVVHMGDHFFAGRFPYVDLGSGGNPQQFTENVGNILEELNEDVKIIPGHGPLSTYSDLKAYFEMLEITVRFIEKQVWEGKTLEEIKAVGLPGWQDWSGDFISTEKWIETVYSGLTKSRES